MDAVLVTTLVYALGLVAFFALFFVLVILYQPRQPKQYRKRTAPVSNPDRKHNHRSL